MYYSVPNLYLYAFIKTQSPTLGADGTLLVAGRHWPPRVKTNSNGVKRAVYKHACAGRSFEVAAARVVAYLLYGDEVFEPGRRLQYLDLNPLNINANNVRLSVRNVSNERMLRDRANYATEMERIARYAKTGSARRAAPMPIPKDVKRRARIKEFETADGEDIAL